MIIEPRKRRGPNYVRFRACNLERFTLLGSGPKGLSLTDCLEDGFVSGVHVPLISVLLFSPSSVPLVFLLSLRVVFLPPSVATSWRPDFRQQN